MEGLTTTKQLDIVITKRKTQNTNTEEIRPVEGLTSTKQPTGYYYYNNTKHAFKDEHKEKDRDG